VTGYVVTAGNYNTEVLQQGAWTQLMLGAATAFPAGPYTNDTCFRSDLGCWWRYDGAAWQQMGEAFFTTANRPAAPPTGFRYFDTTANAVYYYNGAAYTGLSLIVGASAAAQAIANNGTIPSANIGHARIAPAANVTGIILPVGVTGQEIIIINESGFSATFAAQATSNVVGGAANVITAFSAQKFAFAAGLTLWAHVA
jgi:hypothetical protein